MRRLLRKRAKNMQRKELEHAYVFAEIQLHQVRKKLDATVHQTRKHAREVANRLLDVQHTARRR